MEVLHLDDLYNVTINNDDEESEFAVGTIDDADELYLFNKRRMTASPLPEEYQQTPNFVYPNCGGYSQGLVMVSLLGEISLKYHHHMHACAGLWGWLDTDLNVVIPPQYIFAENFVDGWAKVCKGKWETEEGEEGKEYWCDEERWGIIDLHNNEVIPCSYDSLNFIGDTDRYYLAHKGGWKTGNYCIYDLEVMQEILQLDFDFDPDYMFNECFLTEDNVLVFTEHLPGQGIDLIYGYSLDLQDYLVYRKQYTGRTFNGKKRVVIEVDGEKLTVF
jgi:hypothetical protein